jgi:RES domain-containing protein
VRIYRTSKRTRAINDYGGSLVTPGRWNPEGTPILYSSCALSPSILEQMVHMKPPNSPPQLIWACADVDESRHAVHALDALGDIHDIAYTRGIRSTPDMRSNAQPFPWDRRILELIRKTPAPQ